MTFQTRIEMMAAGMTAQEALDRCKYQREYSTAIHEAGHSVMHLRTASPDSLVSLELGSEGGRELQGVARTRSLAMSPIATVAGHFCKYRWGWDEGKKGSFNFSGNGDFKNLVTEAAQTRHYSGKRSFECPYVKKVDRIVARKIWNLNMRRLSALVKRDPSFEAQVRAVADALVEKRWLSGDEVLAIMDRTDGRQQGRICK
jgi:hypothetical protein